MGRHLSPFAGKPAIQSSPVSYKIQENHRIEIHDEKSAGAINLSQCSVSAANPVFDGLGLRGHVNPLGVDARLELADQGKIPRTVNLWPPTRSAYL